MSRLSALTIAATICMLAAPASARVVMYSAHAGDTPESIAADYYGNRSLALFIVDNNGLKAHARLRPGQRIRIPTAFKYRIRRGDTLQALALRFLGDRRRAPFLAMFSGLPGNARLREGQELLIPFQHVHRALAPESLQSVAREFYGDASRAHMLAEYNFHSSPMLAKGERLLVPIAHVRVRAIRLTSPPSSHAASRQQPPLAAAPPKEAAVREEALAAHVASQLAKVEQSYRDGDYQEVPAALDKMLTEEDPSEAQLAEIFRLKAFAYVALGLNDLAVKAFREVLARKPDITFDEATVSPKIRAAFARAKAQL